ncbi:MAG: hypothetical protein ACRDWA_13865 [Acidimicrobiia bacterium]
MSTKILKRTSAEEWWCQSLEMDLEARLVRDGLISSIRHRRVVPHSPGWGNEGGGILSGDHMTIHSGGYT